MDSETAFAQFIEVAREWAIGYTKVVRTYFAIKRNGEWCLEYAMTIFVTDLFDEVDKLVLPEVVETRSLLAIKEVFDFEEAHLEKFLCPVRFDPFASFHDKYDISISAEVRKGIWYYFEPFNPKEFQGNWRWPTLKANSSENLTDQHLPHRDQLDLELMGHKLPYSGLADLCDTFGIPPTIFDRGYSNPHTKWVVTQPAAVLPESAISNEVAKVQIRCSRNVDHESLSVGARILTGQPPIIRKNLPISEFEWDETGEWKTGYAEENLGSAAIADIHLSYNGRYLGHFWINDNKRSLNQRIDIHRLFDKKEVVGSAFFDLKDDFFEDSVSLLLNLSGLTAVSYGGIPSLKEAPDILAYSSVGHLFIVECTTRDVGRSGKLLKLSQRTREVKELVNRGRIEFPHILPVMFTLIPRDDTKACWEEAANFGISLICRENIENLISRIETPYSTGELFEAAQSLIPRKMEHNGDAFQSGT